MSRIRPKNWGEFQHYKDRDPTWIKLHKKLLDDFEYQSLPLASRALAPMLWLIASADKEGWFDADPVKIAFRVRASVKEVEGAIKPLIEASFFEVEQFASKAIAETVRIDSPETETQVQTEIEKKLPARAGRVPDDDPEFEEFWKAYKPPPNSKKPDARKAWDQTAKLRPSQTDLLRAVAAYQSWLTEEGRKQKREYPKQHPATWLRGEVWNGFLENSGAAVDVIASKATWDGQAAPLVDDLGATVFDAWFKDSRLLRGPPAVIEVSKPFQRNWIANNFAGQLKKHFGEFEVRVAA